jgi:hypothetical protein
MLLDYLAIAVVSTCPIYQIYLFSVYPDRCTMSIIGVEDKKRMEEKITFWEDVYGIWISCLSFFAIFTTSRCL